MSKGMRGFDQTEIAFLRRLQRGDSIIGVDRREDRARQRLKKTGHVEFDRAAWLWKLTWRGERLLASIGSPQEAGGPQ